MKYRFLFFLFSFTCIGGNAQVETATWNGKTYYVYPLQKEVSEYADFFRQFADAEEVLERDDKNRKVIGVTIVPVKYTTEPEYLPKGRKQKKAYKLFEDDVSKYPYSYYNFYDFSETTADLTPVMEPLPDGEYIQYYRDLPYIDKRVVRYHNDVVACVFTIRNNLPDGPAQWITAEGKIIQTGNYTEGTRQGTWNRLLYTKNYDLPEGVSPESDDEIIFTQQFDTTIESTDYKLGLKNGTYTKKFEGTVIESGFFTDDQPSGSWEIREFNWEEGKYVLKERFHYPNTLITGKSVIIREGIIPYEYLYSTDTSLRFTPYSLLEEDAFFSTLYPSDILGINSLNFSDFYQIGSDIVETVTELPEEDDSYYIEDETAYNYYDYAEGTALYYGKASPQRNHLIDSLGYQFKYDFYEAFYPNGQLQIRFEVHNGKLAEEDTTYWENGNASTVINFLADSSMYEQLFFDYNGTFYCRKTYDTKGTLISDGQTYENSIIINGRIYEEYNDVLYYDNEEFHEDTLTERTLLTEARWQRDSTVCADSYYDPTTYTYIHKTSSLTGKPVLVEQAVFGENYQYVHATEDYMYGDLRSHTLYNGPLGEYDYGQSYYYPASGDLRYTGAWRAHYDFDQDNTIYKNDIPFTGLFNLVIGRKAFRIKESDHSITVSLPAEGDAFDKTVNNYYTKGKLSPLLDVIVPSTNDERYYYSINAVTQLFPFLNTIFRSTPADHFIEYDYLNDETASIKHLREKQAKVFDKTVEGRILNGKPEGLWITRDQHGHPTTQVNFVNGEIDGEALFYKTVYPVEMDLYNYENEYDYYDAYNNPLLLNSLPFKQTHYLSQSAHYKNGILNGLSVETNWMGDTISSMNYINGIRQGSVFERSKFAFSISEYEDGALDGIAQTYLTIPGEDTLQLYDLNFQNGLLQGESKAYHFNGKIAKRGFFYLGQPIDDFEAFDTLGFRYQYVKFQYNQPVEEKIWEENQLSVRYEFDWRDSIYFNTADIAGSTSLDRLLYELGMGGDYTPYYGRPSLVDKSGINYRMTKYYPNDTIAREGDITSGKKVGCWRFYDYEGKELYEVDYFDSIITVNDSVQFKSKGILTYSDSQGYPTSRSYIVEKFEKYDCAHTDHYEVRMLATFWEKDTSVHRMNGYVKNYYDNGVLQNEGWVKNGVATGVWKFYDPYGGLNQVGEYNTGKRQGRWLSGDLGNVKYLGDICLNPNLPNLEEMISYQEKLLDITVNYYLMGKVVKTQYYGINMNPEEDPDSYYDPNGYKEGNY